MIFVVLSGYSEHYPNKVNYPTLLANSMRLSHPSCTWVKNFDCLTFPAKKQKKKKKKIEPEKTLN